MNTLNHFRMLLPIMVLFAQSVYGQLTTAKDTFINGVLKQGKGICFGNLFLMENALFVFLLLALFDVKLS